MKYKSIITDSCDDTLQLGIKLGQILQPGMVVGLYGDLGAGKTVVSRGIARGLDITVPVTSPTFTVVQEYQLKDNNFLFHLDMYRINNADEAYAFGIEEFLFSSDAITVIEWAERIEEMLTAGNQENFFAIYLAHYSENKREIKLPEQFYSLVCQSENI